MVYRKNIKTNDLSSSYIGKISSFSVKLYGLEKQVYRTKNSKTIGSLIRISIIN